MDFKQIEAFIHVVRHKSFSKAADAIYLTQPTVSAHISSLENELGIKLLDRSSKVIHPTKAGKIFYEYAVNLINTRDEAIFSLNNFTNTLSGKIHVASSTVPSQFIMPQLILEFQKKYKNILFNLVQMDTNQVLEEILENSFEIGIVGSKINNDKLRFESLLEDKMVLITPNNEKFNKFQSDSISLEDLKNEKFIFRESGSGTRKEFEKKLVIAGKDPKSVNIIAQINSAEAIKQAVSLGIGISIASYISVKDYIKFGLIKAFDIKELDLKREFYLVYHKNRPMSPLVNIFKEFVLNYYNKNSSSSV